MFYAPQCHLVKIFLGTKETMYLSTGRCELPEQLVSTITYFQNELKLQRTRAPRITSVRNQREHGAFQISLSQVSLLPLIGDEREEPKIAPIDLIRNDAISFKRNSRKVRNP